MATGSEVLGAALLVVEGGATIAVAVRIARKITPVDLLDRLLVVLLLGIAQIVGIPLVLGCVDLLGRWPVLVAHLVLLAAVTRLVPLEGDARERVRVPTRPVSLVAMGVVSALGAVWLRESLQGGAPADYDSREYHISNLASWFQRHNIWHLPYANPGYITATHPGNGELAALWLVLPTGRDQLAYVAPLLFALLGIVGIAFLTRELGGSAAAGAIVATAVIACPLFFINDVRTIKTDQPAAAGLIVATALVVRYWNVRRTSWLVLAGMALGLGVGSKYTVVLPAALLAVIAIVIVRERTRLLWTVPGLLAFAGPWLLRNAFATGNPIFPEAVAFGGLTIFPGGSTTIDLFSTRMVSHVVHAHTAVLRSWGRLARHFFGPAGLLPIAGVLLFWRRRTLPVIVVTVMALGSAVSYLLTPYTGAGPTGYLALLGSNQRYLMPAILLGSALLAALLPEIVAAVIGLLVFAYDLWFEVQRQTLRADIKPGKGTAAVGLLFGCVVAGAALLLPRVRTARDERGRRSGTPVTAAFAAVLAVVALAGLFVEIHRLDRVGPNDVELTLDRIDGATGPVIVVGVADLRSVVGETLRRPLVLVAAGGKGNEEPFSDRAEVAARYQSGTNLHPAFTPTPTDAVLGRRLDAALIKASRPVLVVGPATSISSPAGWTPDVAAWCVVKKYPALAIYARKGSRASFACASP